MEIVAVISLALLALAACHAAILKPPRKLAATEEPVYPLPKGFLLGAAVSAMQTEGAWNEDGKSESAVDRVIHTLGTSVFPGLHDKAADSYHLYMDDVKMAAKLKLSLYKFSMSWARILPTADSKKPNLKGVQFYHNLIQAIRDHGMTPMVTIYHFDHPQILEDEFKGWQDRRMVDKFAEYAKFVFDEYGSEVDLWATINEPNMYCTYFSNIMFVAAGLRKPEEVPVHDCFHNNILAHMTAYRIFKDGPYSGKVGFTALVMHAQPATVRPEDVYAADAFNQMHAGALLHPVVYGDYPQVVKNLAGSNLTEFTPDEKTNLTGSTDFIGLNMYFGAKVSYNRQPPKNTGTIFQIFGTLMQEMPFVDATLFGSTDPNSTAVFTMITPDVMKDGLLWTYQTLKRPLIICENGFGDSLGLGVHDRRRAAYHSAFLRALVETIRDYGVEVKGYSAWSLIDSFEFTSGYKRPFGLVHVDYENGTLRRSLKDSSRFWIEMADRQTVPLVELENAPSGVSPSNPSVLGAALSTTLSLGTFLLSWLF